LRIREHRVAAAPLPDFTSFDRVASGNAAASGALADHGIKGAGWFFAHDLFRKPMSTFRDHALTRRNQTARTRNDRKE